MFSVDYGTMVMNALFKQGVFTQLTSLYIGLSYTDPRVQVLEPNTGGYARVQMPCDSTHWSDPTVDTARGALMIQNASVVQFPTATADWTNGSNDELLFWFIADAPTGGKVVSSSKLGSARIVYANDPPKFDAGALTLGIVVQ